MVATFKITKCTTAMASDNIKRNYIICIYQSNVLLIFNLNSIFLNKFKCKHLTIIYHGQL